MFEYYDGFLGRRNSIPVNPDDLIHLRLQGLRWLKVAKQVPRIDGGVGISHSVLSQANRVRESHEWRVAVDDYWRRHHGDAPPPQEMRNLLSYPSIATRKAHPFSDSALDKDIEVDPDSGLEVEREDPEIDKPFNPEKIRVRTTNITVELLVSRIRHNEVDLEPDFQRSFVWKAERQSRLIESLLLRIPIPVFYVAADENENWLVVDGVQRMFTIYNYLTDQFRLSELEYLDKFNKKRYSDLPRQMQRRIGESELVVNIIDPGTPEDVMFNIFHRINTGGITLNGQEIRNALHPGPVRQFLKTLAQTEQFLRATDKTIKPDRMADRECVLRFIAFYVDPWEKYDDNDLNGFLSRAMTKINNMDTRYREELATEFKKAMEAAYHIFGSEAFRKRYDRNESHRRPVSKALFDAWSVELSRCNPQEIDKLVEKREKITDRFIELINSDSEFDRAISYSTGTPQRVKKRFHAIAQLVSREL